MTLLARVARERVEREHAAADLRLLRLLTAVAGLVHGKDAGRRLFEETQAELLEKANGIRNAGKQESEKPVGRRRRRS